MAKKIFDIIPPGASFKEEKSQQTKIFEKRSDLRPQIKKSEEKTSFSPAKLLIPAAILALFFGTAYFLIEAEAKIEIWPETSSANPQYHVSLKAGVSGQQVDLEQNIIPALLVQNTIENKMIFPSTGPIENKAKAKGTLRVYNKYEPPAAFSLVIGTRFLSSPQEKTFKSLEKINLPAATYKDGKLVPGFVDILVEADQSGASYNISSSVKFSIPKLVGTNYFYTTVAENLKPLEGGSDTGVKTVTKEDLDKAKSQFLEESFKKAKTALASSIQSDFTLLEGLLNQEASGDIVFSAKEKDARDNFEISGKIASKALVFKQSDVDAYSESLLKAANSSKKIAPGSLKIIPIGRSIDFNQQTAQLDLSVNSKTYMLDEEQNIKELLKGQKLDYAVSLINNSSGVEKANIILSPFWRNKLPSDTDKIQTKLNFDGE